MSERYRCADPGCKCKFCFAEIEALRSILAEYQSILTRAIYALSGGGSWQERDQLLIDLREAVK